jgi:hypothetical protein
VEVGKEIQDRRIFLTAGWLDRADGRQSVDGDAVRRVLRAKGSNAELADRKINQRLLLMRHRGPIFVPPTHN